MAHLAIRGETEHNTCILNKGIFIPNLHGLQYFELHCLLLVTMLVHNNSDYQP